VKKCLEYEMLKRLPDLVEPMATDHHTTLTQTAVVPQQVDWVDGEAAGARPGKVRPISGPGVDGPGPYPVAAPPAGGGRPGPVGL